MTTTETPNVLSRSAQAFAEANLYMPGGVNSPVRAFHAVGGNPVFMREGAGCRMTDIDGQTYIDYIGSWGPLIAGHAHPAVVAAISKALMRGSSFGAPTELETRLAKLVVQAVPGIEKVRFVNSGTEAAMSALRVVRAYTGRTKLIKFAGCYHGHVDALLVKAGSGATTLGVPDSPGVPETLVGATLLAEYNDLDSVRALLEAHPQQVAAILVEPVAGNMGLVPPEPGFLEGLRHLADGHGSLLVFDEVMTGFRLARGGAQELYGVTPDITCLGKIIGGGLPVGAYGGRADIMNLVSPAGPVYQAGTLSGNPLAMAAGIATLELIFQDGAYQRLDAISAMLSDGLRQAAERAGLATYHTRVGSMLGLFFTDRPVRNYADAKTCDTARYARFFQAMLRRGVYLPPAQFEALFVSLAHTEADIEETIAAAREAFAVMDVPTT